MAQLTRLLKDKGYDAHLSQGVETTLVGAVGAQQSSEEKADFMEQIKALPYVDKVMPVAKPYKLVNRQFHPEPTVIDVRGREDRRPRTSW